MGQPRHCGTKVERLEKELTMFRALRWRYGGLARGRREVRLWRFGGKHPEAMFGPALDLGQQEVPVISGPTLPPP